VVQLNFYSQKQHTHKGRDVNNRALNISDKVRNMVRIVLCVDSCCVVVKKEVLFVDLRVI